MPEESVTYSFRRSLAREAAAATPLAMKVHANEIKRRRHPEPSMSVKLRRSLVLATFEKMLLERGYSPTLKEISATLHLRMGQVSNDISALLETGKLRQPRPGQHRGLVPVGFVEHPFCPFCKQQVRK